MSRARWRAAWAAAVAVAACWPAVEAATAPAHVLLDPGRAAPHTLVLFTVLSPDEARVPLTGLRLAIPSALVVSSIADTPGYTAQVVRDQSFRPVALSWQGGRTAPGHLALFRFAALTPAKPGAVTLTGVQTFADGSTHVWRSARLLVAAPAASTSDNDGLLIAAGVAGAVLGAAGLGLAALALRRVRAG